jgi:hypothetical protein
LQIVESLSDAMALSGSEVYAVALIFYNAVKSAMKSKVPKAETIYNDLISLRYKLLPLEVLINISGVRVNTFQV